MLPLGRLLNNANFQALAVIPWTAGGIERLWPLTNEAVANKSFATLEGLGWFGPDEARRLVVKAQAAFVDRLEELLR